MRWLRRGRSLNNSGYDGASSPGEQDGPPFPFWVSVLLVWVNLLCICSASDVEADFAVNIEEAAGSDSDVCSAATTQPIETGQGHPAADSDRGFDPHKHDTEEMLNERQAVLEAEEWGTKMIFHNRPADLKFGVRFYEPTCCVCTGSEPDEDCNGMTMDVSWSELCLQLHLSPEEPVLNVTTGFYCEILYPWEDNEDLACQYDNRDDYDYDPDIFAWWRHSDAIIRLPLHKKGVGLVEFELSGQPLIGRLDPDEFKIPIDKCAEEVGAGDKDVNKEDASAGMCEEEEEEEEETCPAEQEGEAQFEFRMHTDIDTFLRFQIYPFHLRPENADGKKKGQARKRKSWAQNARRRYQLRTVADTETKRLLEMHVVCMWCHHLSIPYDSLSSTRMCVGCITCVEMRSASRGS